MFRFSYDSGLNGNSGVYGQSGLYEKSGLYEVEFNLQNLDPYLLFDTRESMIGTLENPTLDLDPSNPDSLDVITATRASVATRTLPDGTIALAEQDTVRVDYTQGAELTPTKFQRVGYTDFSQGWSKYVFGGASLEVTDGYVSPTGNNDAYKFDLVVGTGGVLFTNNITLESATDHTLSVWLKGEVGGEKVRLDLKNTSSSGVSGSFFTVTNEWQRYEVTVTADATNRGFQFRLTASNGVGDQTLYVYGPQLEEGTTASDFVANTTGSPKFITGPTFSPRVPMILVEPSATNLVTNSTSFTENTDLTKTTGIDAPDGTNTASKISGILSSSSSDMAYSIASTVTSSTQVTGSIYVRGIAGEVVVLRLKRYTGGAYVASGPQTITLTGDWQRVEGLTMTLGADNTNAAVSIRKESGSTADSVDLWGGQIETGSVATSYIPTSGSTVTRAADDLQIERDSTNLVTDSAYFSEASITVTKIGNNFEAPDGSLTASKFSGITNAVGDRIYTLYTGVSSSTQITGSVYLKGTAGEVALIQHKRISGGTYAASAQISLTLDGTWQRVATGLTYTTAADTTHSVITIRHDSAGTADELLVWGAQIEEGSEATSLIPTSGATASRTTFSDFYNQSEGTVYIELTSEDDGKNSYPVYFTQDIAGYAERNNGTWAIQKDGTPNVYLASWANGGFVSDSLIVLGSYTAGNLTRVSVSYDSNSYEGSKDGASVQTSTPTTMATTLVDRLFVGGSGIFQNSSRIKRLIYWPTSSDRL